MNQTEIFSPEVIAEAADRQSAVDREIAGIIYRTRRSKIRRLRDLVARQRPGMIGTWEVLGGVTDREKFWAGLPRYTRDWPAQKYLDFVVARLKWRWLLHLCRIHVPRTKIQP